MHLFSHPEQCTRRLIDHLCNWVRVRQRCNIYPVSSPPETSSPSPVLPPRLSLAHSSSQALSSLNHISLRTVSVQRNGMDRYHRDTLSTTHFSLVATCIYPMQRPGTGDDLLFKKSKKIITDHARAYKETIGCCAPAFQIKYTNNCFFFFFLLRDTL